VFQTIIDHWTYESRVHGIVGIEIARTSL